MQPATRHIQRPRPSLCCETCQRRKVRCDKDQPICGSCKRMGEPCKFNRTATKVRASTQERAKPFPNEDGHHPGAVVPELPSSATFSSSNGSTDVSEPSAEQSPCLPPPVFGENDETTEMSINGGDSLSPTANIAMTGQRQQHQQWNDASISTQPWLSSLLRGVLPSVESHQASKGDDVAVSPQRTKRRRSIPDLHCQMLDLKSLNSTRNGAREHYQTPVSATFQNSNRSTSFVIDKDEKYDIGYRSAGDSVRPRYVETTHWAYIKSQVGAPPWVTQMRCPSLRK